MGIPIVGEDFEGGTLVLVVLAVIQERFAHRIVE